MKTKRFIHPVILIFFLLIIPAKPAAIDKEPVIFKINLAQVDDRGYIFPLNINKEINLPVDSYIKFYLSPESQCYLYLINRDSANNITVYHTTSNEQPEARTAEKNFFIPPENNKGLRLQNGPDVNKFYLIASAARLENLEKAIKAYEKSLQKGSPEKIMEQKHYLLDIVKNIRNRYNPYKTVIVMPARITGILKGIQEDLKSCTMTIEAQDLYVKTIRIVLEK